MIARLLELLTRPFEPEVIGAEECPLVHRWTIGWDRVFDRLPVKLLLHHFLPTSRDRDPHDHPRSFWTFVLAGEYLDEHIIGVGEHAYRVVPERMKAGTLRFRPARHMHRTWTGEEGAWTIVLMGPKVREWGFLRDSRWWPFRQYETRFGAGMRCE